MKSISWPVSSRTALWLCGAVALSLGACAKDPEATAPRGKTASPDPSPSAKGFDPTLAMGQGQGAARSLPPGVLGLGEKGAPVDTSYSIQVEAPETLAAGAEGVTRVHVLPGKGWKMNFDFPTRLQVTPPEGVSVVKDRLQIPDAERFEEAGATFAVKYTASSSGPKSFKADFKFAVCTDVTCDPKRQELAWVVNVP